MPVKTPQELFVHELGDIFDAEQQLIHLLPRLAKEAVDPQIESAYQQHLAETKQQISNLIRCYQLLSQHHEDEEAQPIVPGPPPGGIFAYIPEEFSNFIPGAKPGHVPCFALKGIEKEHDHFAGEKLTPDMLELFDLGIAAKTEQYEIASYRLLADQAAIMGLDDIAELLSRNLVQEEAMEKKLMRFEHDFAQRMAPDLFT